MPAAAAAAPIVDALSSAMIARSCLAVRVPFVAIICHLFRQPPACRVLKNAWAGYSRATQAQPSALPLERLRMRRVACKGRPLAEREVLNAAVLLALVLLR